MDIFNYNRRVSSVTNVGGVLLGGDNPIRIQSMTDTSTRDIEASVNQVLDIADAGGIMPPKSTWFEPKLRDGLVCHNF